MDPNYAGFWRRFLAASLDNFVWVVFYIWFYGAIVAGAYEASPTAGIVLLFVYASLWFNYFAFCEWRWGQTIGKNATGIEVRAVDRSPRLTYGQASLRNLLRLIDFFVIGEVMIVASKRKQRLGDQAAKTVVLRRAATKRVAPDGAPSHEAPTPQPITGAAEPVAPPAAEPVAEEPRMPEVPWSLADTIWGLIGGLLLVVIVPPLLVLPFDPNLGDPDKASDAAILATQALFDGFLVAVAIGMASGWHFRLRDALGRLGLRGFEPSAFGWMFAMLGTYYAGAIAFSALVVQPDQEDIGKELGVCNPGIGIAVAAVLAVVVLAPFAEELFFRGFFFAGLRTRWGLWPSALLSGGIFGLVHAPTGPTAAIPLAGLGVGLAWLYNKTGSIYPCMLAHFLNNALAISVVVASC
jgi:membrane protease YdiL (CAAX protease family)